jgi:hypothetical protein
MLIAGFTLVQKLVPSGALTEGLNWTITALGVGAAVGAWTAGLIADSAGGTTAWWMARKDVGGVDSGKPTVLRLD